MLLDIEPVIWVIAIPTQLFLALEVYMALCRSLTAAIAFKGVKNSCFLRQRDGSLLYIEHVLRLESLKILEGGLATHVLGPFPERKPDTLAGFTVIK